MSDLPKTTKIHDLPKVSEVNDSDIFIIQSDENTNKIDGADLKSVMQKQAITATYDHTSDNEIHVTKAEKELWNSMSGGGSDFFVTKEELEEAMTYENESVADVTNVKEALDGIFNGTQQVGDSAKLGGKDASEYLLKEIKLLPNGTDLNNVTENGKYFCNSYASNYVNAPTNANNGILEVQFYNATRIHQRYYSISQHITYERDYNSNEWSGWNSYLPLSGGIIKDGTNSPLILNNTLSNDSTRTLLGFQRNGVSQGYIGYSGTDKPVVYSGSMGEHTLLHTGNKPSGSYTGNGDATNRTVSVGGIGKAILVRPIGTKDFAVVTESGYTGKLNGSPVVGEDALVLNSGDLWIQSNSSLFNASDKSYYYERL